MPVDVQTQVGDDAPARDMGHVAAHKAQHSFKEIDGQRQHGQAGDDGPGLQPRSRIGDRSDHGAHDPGANELCAHEQRHAQDGQR